MKRVILIVLDSLGVGALPDAGKYGDEGANTLGRIAQNTPLHIPNLINMGLYRLPGIKLPEAQKPLGLCGRMKERSAGKDTTTGHWEMAGLTLDKPFPTFPEGFPKDFIKRFESATGRKTLGNTPASGTAILDELSEEHLKTGALIVYTSADSVFQIAAHEELVPLPLLYEYCKIAREMLTGPLAVGRVIARPFTGPCKGQFIRSSGRRDFSLEPTGKTLLDCLKEAGHETIGIGKIEDIFCMKGLSASDHAAGNPACIQSLFQKLERDFSGLLFVNLVDFDMLYGHRRDIAGYAQALEDFDKVLPQIKAALGPEDLLFITADHGCDPGYSGTDHTREYVPILAWSPKMTRNILMRDRESFADLAASISEFFGLPDRFQAESFLSKVEEC